MPAYLFDHVELALPAHLHLAFGAHIGSERPKHKLSRMIFRVSSDLLGASCEHFAHIGFSVRGICLQGLVNPDFIERRMLFNACFCRNLSAAVRL